MYSNKLVYDILIYIDINIKNKISINDLVSNLNYNRFYIMKLFKKEMHISINNYINIIKIYNSLNYINDNINLISVALKSGFYSLEYYSEIFKKILGVNPSIYKKIINRNKNVNEKDIDICMKNLTYIKSIIDSSNNYKKNLKPSTMPVKKLTIFK